MIVNSSHIDRFVFLTRQQCLSQYFDPKILIYLIISFKVDSFT